MGDADLEAAFGMFDTEGDGTVSKANLGAVLGKLGMTPDDSELQSMMDEVNVGGSGSVTKDEFMAVCKRTATAEATKELTEAFKEWEDKDAPGHVDASALRHALVSLSDMGDDKADQMIGLAGGAMNEDGKINIDAFVKVRCTTGARSLP